MLKIGKNHVKHFLGQYPELFNTVYKSLGKNVNQELLCGKETEIVIEGFPRSANTFAVVYFDIAQNGQVKIAHHLHIEGQLIWAARNNFPGIVLIRNPEDCIRSLLVRESNATIESSLKRYIKFYENLIPYESNLVIAPFERVITDMAAVIIECNKKYGTRFNVLEHTHDVEIRVYKRIDEINDRLDSGRESHVARPSLTRKSVAKDIDLSQWSRLLSRANEVFTFFTKKIEVGIKV